LKIKYSTQFKKDFKRIKKQNKDIDKLKKIIELLTKNEPLPPKFKDHQLSGQWKLHRDCHIEPDWILIYMIDSNALVLERTGSHSDLFK